MNFGKIGEKSNKEIRFLRQEGVNFSGFPVMPGQERMNLHTKTEILKGDITKVIVDAIVNAANTSLLGGGCKILIR